MWPRCCFLNCAAEHLRSPGARSWHAGDNRPREHVQDPWEKNVPGLVSSAHTDALSGDSH